MFVRIKTTPNSPRKSVQIVQSVRKGDKVSQKIVRHVGIAHDDNELKQLKLLAEAIKIKLEAGHQQLLFTPEELANMKMKKEKKLPETEEDYKVNLKKLIEEQRVVTGIHDIYGHIFDQLGFDKSIKDYKRNKSSLQILKDIVMARVANPASKMASVHLLEEEFGISLDLNRVYQMMDKLDDDSIDKINNLAHSSTVSLFQNKIDIIFYDCTTLYFESFKDDDFKSNGYSKDLKFNQPQVLFALMVTKDGLPIGYKAFEGSKYEGHTLIPSVQDLRKKYDVDKVVFVADAGMFNEENLLELEKENIEFIVGCRLKNLPKKLKTKVLDLKLSEDKGSTAYNFNTMSCEYNGRKLVVSRSRDRAAKNAYDREKAIEKIKNKLAKKKNPKEFLSNYGNKKYLKIEGKASVILNEEKIATDGEWDGLRGVITSNRTMTNDEILTHYTGLWQVESAFRINKHDLKIRPIFHWKPRRIKAHLAIAFIAYTLVKYLEYRVKLQYKAFSPEKIRQILIKVQTSISFEKEKKIRYGLPSKISLEARKIYKIFNIPYKLTPYIIKRL